MVYSKPIKNDLGFTCSTRWTLIKYEFKLPYDPNDSTVALLIEQKYCKN